MVANLDHLPANPDLGDTYFCPKVGGYWVWRRPARTDGPDPGGSLNSSSNGFHFHLL
jgi:hypothetical protein